MVQRESSRTDTHCVMDGCALSLSLSLSLPPSLCFSLSVTRLQPHSSGLDETARDVLSHTTLPMVLCLEGRTLEKWM